MLWAASTGHSGCGQRPRRLSFFATLLALLALGMGPGTRLLLTAAQSCPFYSTSQMVAARCMLSYKAGTCIVLAHCTDCAKPVPSTISSSVDMTSCPTEFIDVDCTGACAGALSGRSVTVREGRSAHED